MSFDCGGFCYTVAFALEHQDPYGDESIEALYTSLAADFDLLLVEMTQDIWQGEPVCNLQERPHQQNMEMTIVGRIADKILSLLSRAYDDNVDENTESIETEENQ